MGMSAEEFQRRLPQARAALRLFIAKRVFDRLLAEEIEQATLVKAHARLGMLRQSNRLVSWLRSIAHNEIRSQYRRRKHRSLAEESPEALAPAAPGAVAWEALEALMARAAAATDNPVYLLTAAMFYGLNWSAEDIAAHMNTRVMTVYKRLARLRDIVKRTGPSLEPAPDDRAFMTLARTAGLLFNSGWIVLRGNRRRNLDLMREGYEWTKRLWQRHGGASTLPVDLCQMAFYLGMVAQEEQGTVPSDQWRRESWDRRWIHVGMEHYEQARRLALSRADALYLDLQYYLYTPAENAAVPWEKILDISRELAGLRPEIVSGHWHLADSLRVLGRSQEALEYLEGVIRRPALRNARHLWGQMASMAFAAGAWRKALQYYKAFLRYPMSDEMRRQITQRLLECDRHRRAARLHSAPPSI